VVALHEGPLAAVDAQPPTDAAAAPRAPLQRPQPQPPSPPPPGGRTPPLARLAVRPPSASGAGPGSAPPAESGPDDDPPGDSSPPASPAVVLARAGTAAFAAAGFARAGLAPTVGRAPPSAMQGAAHRARDLHELITAEQRVAAAAAAAASAAERADDGEGGADGGGRIRGGAGSKAALSDAEPGEGGCGGTGGAGGGSGGRRRAGAVGGGPSCASLTQWSSGSFMAESPANWVIDFSELVSPRPVGAHSGCYPPGQSAPGRTPSALSARAARQAGRGRPRPSPPACSPLLICSACTPPQKHSSVAARTAGRTHFRCIARAVPELGPTLRQPCAHSRGPT